MLKQEYSVIVEDALEIVKKYMIEQSQILINELDTDPAVIERLIDETIEHTQHAVFNMNINLKNTKNIEEDFVENTMASVIANQLLKKQAMEIFTMLVNEEFGHVEPSSSNRKNQPPS